MMRLLRVSLVAAVLLAAVAVVPTSKMDVANSAGQWARDVGKEVLALPGEVDWLEHKANNWLKSNAITSGIGEALDKLEPQQTMLTNSIPAPNREDVDWTDRMLFGDTYQPQTTAGKITDPILTGATIGVGAALGAMKFGSFVAKYGRPFAKYLLGGAVTGAGGTAGYYATRGRFNR